MSYMWNEFNIKTFKAETVVFRNGLFCKDLSSLDSLDISKKYKLPVHIIYVGEIQGVQNVNININVDNQNVFLSVNIKNKKPAFLNFFIKNTGKNSEFRGHILLNNFDNLVYKCFAEHNNTDNTIIIKNKLVAEKNTVSEMSAVAKINKNCKNVVSDIGFSVLTDKNAIIKLNPTQEIHAGPKSADHSADIYQPNSSQILYLKESGLGQDEINNAMREAFICDFEPF